MHMKYDGDVFPAGVSKSLHSGTTNSLFESSEFVIAYGRSASDCLLSAYCFIDAQRTLAGERACLYNFKIQNIVCFTQMPRALNLNQFELDHPLDSSWEEIIFAGLKWELEPPEPKISFILFRKSGNIVVAGIKTMEMIEFAESKLHEIAKYMLPEGVESEEQTTTATQEEEEKQVIQTEQDKCASTVAVVEEQAQVPRRKRIISQSTTHNIKRRKVKLQTIRLLL